MARGVVVALILSSAAVAACVQLLGGDQDPTFTQGARADAATEGGFISGGTRASDGRAPNPDFGPWCRQEKSDAYGCWDFDLAPANLLRGWDGDKSIQGRGLVVVDNGAPSAPHTYRASARSDAGAAGARSVLETGFELTGFTTMEVGFDLRVHECTPNSSRQLIVANLYLENIESGARVRHIFVQLRIPTASKLETLVFEGDDARPPGDHGFTNASWSSVKFQITRIGKTATVVTSALGKTATAEQVAYDTTVGGNGSLRIGVDGDPSAPPLSCEISYDNVWLDWTN